VIRDEGSYSYKAIVFISRKSSQNNARIETKSYYTFRRSLQKSKVFSKNPFSTIERREYFNEKLGDKKWIK